MQYIQETSDGDIERTLCIGLRPTGIIGDSSSSSKHQHEIMAVNMIQKSVVKFDSRAPENSRAEESLCGSPDAYQPTANRGTPGRLFAAI